MTGRVFVSEHERFSLFLVFNSDSIVSKPEFLLRSTFVLMVWTVFLFCRYLLNDCIYLETFWFEQTIFLLCNVVA